MCFCAANQTTLITQYPIDKRRMLKYNADIARKIEEIKKCSGYVFGGALFWLFAESIHILTWGCINIYVGFIIVCSIRIVSTANISLFRDNIMVIHTDSLDKWHLRLSTIYLTPDIHPSPKVMADFFQTQKLTWCPYPIYTIFGGCIKCMQVFIFCAKYIHFLH